MSLLKAKNDRLVILDSSIDIIDIKFILGFSGKVQPSINEFAANSSFTVSINSTDYKILLYKPPDTGSPNTGYLWNMTTPSENGSRIEASTHKYAPTPNTWSTQTASSGYDSTGSMLVNNKLYDAYSRGSGGQVQSLNREYSPDVWVQRTSGIFAKCWVGLATINNKGFSWGGWGDSGTGPQNQASNEQYIFDSWSSKTALPSPYFDIGTFSFSTTGFALGGDNDAGSPTAATREYLISSDAWASRQSMPYTSSTSYGYGISGSYGYRVRSGESLLEYSQPPTNSWVSKVTCSSHHNAPTFTINDMFYVMGDYLTTSPRLVQYYTRSSNSWTSVANTLIDLSYGGFGGMAT